MADEQNSFNYYAKQILDREYRFSILRAGDDLFMAMQWFQSHNVEFTAKDLFAFSELVRRKRDEIQYGLE